MKIEQSNIDKIRSRPRFKIETGLTKAQVFERLKSHWQKNSDKFEGNINSETAIIRVKTPETDLWKPQLELRTENEDGKTLIRGVFGPNSSVWTFFMFLYFVFGILSMIFFTLWFVGNQLKTNDYDWCLYAGIASLIAIFGIYFSAKFGQKKSEAELESLRNFALDALKNL